MARIVVGSIAYLGDVAPYVAPANLLAERGHDVTFLTAAGFHDMLRGERFALATYPLDLSASGMHADPEHEKLMRHPLRNQLRLPSYWMRRSFTADPVAARHALEATIEGADVLVTHPTFGSVAVPMAEYLGVPIVVGQLFPMMLPTRQHGPPLGKRCFNFGGRTNKAMWRVMGDFSGRLLADKPINAYRRSLGLPAVRGNAFNNWMTADRTVMLVSPHYWGDAPADWPPLTWGGFSHWPGPASMRDAPLDPAVDAFIDAGDPPVLVTLGSSAATGAGEAFEAMADGLDRLGLRALLLVGNDANLETVRHRDGAFLFAPLDKVLPRVRAAVVSGAIGSLAAALSAGVPVVVLPQLFDQVWHGGRVEDLGVGRMVWRTRSVAAAVAAVVADSTYRERARALAVAMVGEDGATALADAAESLL
jgi:UDP:flavonoid glycosyltransferase YjiC (YdhE family)